MIGLFEECDFLFWGDCIWIIFTTFHESYTSVCLLTWELKFISTYLLRIYIYQLGMVCRKNVVTEITQRVSVQASVQLHNLRTN